MLTTTLDGLWVLQVLAGIEVVAPELGLRPHLPSIEAPHAALSHPVAAELRAAGVIDESGAVDADVLEWLTVLSRRDVAVVLYVQTPDGAPELERVVIARFARWWVSLERAGAMVRLGAAGTATSEQSAGQLIGSHFERLCGQMAPAPVRPMSIDVEDLQGNVRDRETLRKFLIERRFDADQVLALTLAADRERSAQASAVAIQAGAPRGAAGGHVGPGTVTIIDTPRGRLLCEHITRDGRPWMIVTPGSVRNIASAVVALMRGLPACDEWFSYRKVV